MFSAWYHKFRTDESGGLSVMMMPWIMLFLAVSGLATDTTRAFQVQTMLQGTADAAALAASIDLPNKNAATDTALEYVEKNLPSSIYGKVASAADLSFGRWDEDNHIFLEGESPPDSVRIKVQQSVANGNPVLTTLLRIIGVTHWDLTRYAIAQKFTPSCFRDGLIARGYVDTSSNNQYYKNFCIHGEQGVMLQSGGYFEPGTTVSMPDLSLLQLPSSGLSSNQGLKEALIEARLNPRMVDHVPDIIQEYLDPKSGIIPDYIDRSQPVIEVDWKYNLNNSIPGRIYHVVCPPKKQIGIPSQQVLSKVIVIADCQIGVPAQADMEDVVLASWAPASNDGANIHFSSNIDLGRHDNCADGGGVKIFTTESLFFSSSVNYNGVQIVSSKDVTLGSSDEGVKGISVQARGNIYLSSNNMYGLCSGGDPLLITQPFYRLVF